MSPTRSYKRCWLAMVILLFTLLLANTYYSAAAPSAQASAANWYSLGYDTNSEGNGLQAIGLDAQGNGWIATLVNGNITRLFRLQSGRVAVSDFSSTSTYISALRSSSDGKTAWAIGASQDNPGQTNIYQYANGMWLLGTTLSPLRSSDPPPSQSLQYEMVVDISAHNGWAVGVDSSHLDRPVLLQLTNDKWQDMTSLLPIGVGFTHIAASSDLKYVWAGGYDRNHNVDAALYYLKDGKWVTVSQPVGHYRIDGLAVDGSGSGWAILGANDQPANSPVLAGLLRLHPDSTWTLVKSDVIANGSYIFNTIALDANGNGWIMGHNLGIGNRAPLSSILRLQGDSISNWQITLGSRRAGVQNDPRFSGLPSSQRYPVYGQPSSIAISANGDAWAITSEGYLLRYGSLPFPIPALATFVFADLNTSNIPSFATGYELQGPFLSYWQKHGALRQFGMPITPELIEKLEDGKEYVIQYTERARFEYHPESDAANQVQLGLLGDKLAEGRQNESPFQHSPAMANPVASYFGETGHNLMPPIGDYWKKNGGLPVFGYPISEAFQEKSPTDGKSYQVQYFERNRLEYHPQNRDPQYQVLLGLLGNQQYQRVYGTPPPLVPNPLPLPPNSP